MVDGVHHTTSYVLRCRLLDRFDNLTSLHAWACRLVNCETISVYMTSLMWLNVSSKRFLANIIQFSFLNLAVITLKPSPLPLYQYKIHKSHLEAPEKKQKHYIFKHCANWGWIKVNLCFYYWLWKWTGTYYMELAHPRTKFQI